MSKTVHQLPMLIILLLSFTTSHAQSEKRLIIGSGRAVQQVYPYAREVTKDDITVDIRSSEHEKYIEPDYVLDVSELHQITPFSDSLSSYFDSIIFEHVGDGMASLFKEESTFFNALKSYFDLLKTGGQFVYESFRTSSSYSDNVNEDLDFGLAQLLEEHIHAIPEHVFTDEETLYPSKRFAKVTEYYEMAFKNSGFKDITVKVEVDEQYLLFKPSNTPYYFISVHATK